MPALIKAIIALVASFPEVLRLIKHLNDSIEQDKMNRKVKDDLKEINDAFSSKDAKALNDIFHNRMRTDKGAQAD